MMSMRQRMRRAIVEPRSICSMTMDVRRRMYTPTYARGAIESQSTARGDTLVPRSGSTGTRRAPSSFGHLLRVAAQRSPAHLSRSHGGRDTTAPRDDDRRQCRLSLGAVLCQFQDRAEDGARQFGFEYDLRDGKGDPATSRQHPELHRRGGRSILLTPWARAPSPPSSRPTRRASR